MPAKVTPQTGVLAPKASRPVPQRVHDNLEGRGLLAALVQAMPDETLVKLVHQISWWLEVASKSSNQSDGILIHLSDRVLEMHLDAASSIEPDDEEEADPIGRAINHPVGLITQALLNLWFKRKSNDNDRIATIFFLNSDRKSNAYDYDPAPIFPPSPIKTASQLI